MCWDERGLRGRGAADVWRLGAAGQSEPVHLADHRIAGDAAQLRRRSAKRRGRRPTASSASRRVRQSSSCHHVPGQSSRRDGSTESNRGSGNGCWPDAYSTHISRPIYSETVRRTKCLFNNRKLYYGGSRAQESARPRVHMFRCGKLRASTLIRCTYSVRAEGVMRCQSRLSGGPDRTSADIANFVEALALLIMWLGSIRMLNARMMRFERHTGERVDRPVRRNRIPQSCRPSWRHFHFGAGLGRR